MIKMIIIFIISTFSVFGQNIIFEKYFDLKTWSASFGNSIFTNDNNLAISCTKIDSTGSDEFDYVYFNLVKLDKNGNLLWDKEIQRYCNGAPYYINRNNDIMCYGRFFKARSGPYIGDFYLVTVKVNLNGEILYKNIDTSSIQPHFLYSPAFIHLKSGNSIFVSNYIKNTESEIGFRIKFHDENGFFLKEDSIFLFNKYGKYHNIIPAKIIQTYDSDIIISSLIYSADNKSDFDSLSIIKLDNSNKIKNTYKLPVPSNFTIISLIEDKNHDLIVLGNTIKSNNIIKNNILRFDENINLISQKTFENYSDIILNGIKCWQDGYLLFGKKIYLIDYPVTYGFYISNISYDFNINWEKVWNVDTNSKIINDINLDSNNVLFLSGATTKIQTFPYYAKIDLPINSVYKLSKNANQTISFLTNLNKVLIDIEYKYLIINLQIFSLLGEKVYENNFTGGTQYEIDFSTLSPGIYFARIEAGGKVWTEKIIKIGN